MNMVKEKPEWWFYLAWIWVLAISFPVTFVLSWTIISIIEEFVGGTMVVGGQTRITEDYLLTFVMLPLVGVITGVIQYLLLRRYLVRIAWWIAATTVGWILPLIGSRLLSSVISGTLDPYYSLAWYLLIGLSIGVCQWLVLRKRLEHAALWVIANVIGWGLAGPIVGSTLSSLLDAVAIFLLPGAVTGVAWWLLLDKLPQPDDAGSLDPSEAS